MRKTLPLFILAAALAGPLTPATTHAKTGGDLQAEYLQVRKIALKDPRVREAFERANERLDERILEIDPALKPIVNKESAHAPAVTQPQVTKVARHASPAASPKPSAHPTAHEHVVASGETLGSIAEHHHVTLTALKTANHITDERKLRVGQKLVIPSTAARVEQSKPIQEANSDGNGGWWSQLKKDL